MGTAGPVTVTVTSGGQSQSVAFTAADWTRPFPAVVTLPAAAGRNAVTITSTGGAAYWTASARYYDTAEGLERTGTRKLALSRKYFTLAPVRRNGRVVYDERLVNAELVTLVGALMMARALSGAPESDAILAAVRRTLG